MSAMANGGVSGQPGMLRRVILLASALLTVALLGASGPWCVYVLRAPGLYGGGLLCVAGVAALFVLSFVNYLRTRRGKPALLTTG